MRRLFLSAALLAACATTRDIPAPDTIELPAIRFTMQDFQLPSGLRIVVQQDHSSPTVAVVTVVGTGALQDPHGKEGLAHLVEHLTFRARSADGASVWDRLEAAGAGDFNGETRSEATIFTTAGSIQALPAILRTETERLLDPIAGIDDATLATEREIVRNELREKAETGFEGSILTWLYAALFPPDHPYARPRGGTHETLSAITLADVQKFAKIHYRTDNMTMMIVGDIELEKVRELLQSSLSNRILGDGAHPIAPQQQRLSLNAPSPPPTPSHPPFHYEGPVAQPEVWIAWTLPGSYRPSGDVMLTVVSALAEFWLSDAIREDRDIENIEVDVLHDALASILLCRVTPQEGKDPEKSASHVLDEVWKTAVLPQSVMRRMSRVIADSLALGAEAPRGRAENTALFTHFSGAANYYSRNIEAILRMDADQVTSYAKHYLDRDRARVLVIQPSGRRGFKPAVGAAPERKGLQPATNEEPVAHSPRDVLTIARSPDFTSFSRGRLPTGLEFVIARRGSLPVVSMGLAFHGGTAAGTKPGVVELAEGAGVPEKAHDEGDWGGLSSSGEDSDLVAHYMRGFSTAVEPLLALLSERVQSMRARYTIIENFKKYRLDVLRRREQSGTARARRAFWKALYGNHPYGRATSAADLENLSQGDANDWIARSYHPRNAVLAVVGNVGAANVQQMVRNWFAEWKGDSDGGVVRPPPPPSLEAHPPQVLVTSRRGATQGEIWLGCLLPPGDDAAEPVYDLLAETIKRHLFRSLRQQLGATYDVEGAAIELRGGAAHLILTTIVENGGLSAALRTIHDALAAFDSGKLDEKEINAARWDLARRFNLRFTTNSAVMAEILERSNKGWPVYTIDQYPERLAAVTTSDLRTAFQTCSNTEALMVSGDDSIVRAALAEGWQK